MAPANPLKNFPMHDRQGMEHDAEHELHAQKCTAILHRRRCRRLAAPCRAGWGMRERLHLRQRTSLRRAFGGSRSAHRPSSAWRRWRCGICRPSDGARLDPGA